MRRISTALLVGALMVGLMPAGAQAAKPLDVDCDVLKSTMNGVHLVLQAAGIDFESIGNLKKDPAVLGQLSSLILFFSAGTIDFDDREVLPTVAKCGLMPFLVGIVQQ